MHLNVIRSYANFHIYNHVYNVCGATLSHNFSHWTHNITTTSTLTLDHVDILLYDFSLTKTGHLRQTTMKIIKEKIPDMVSSVTLRRTRSMFHNHGDVGLQLDEDNALVPVMKRMRPHKSHLVHRMDLKEKAYRWKLVVLIHNL